MGWVGEGRGRDIVRPGSPVFIVESAAKKKQQVPHDTVPTVKLHLGIFKE